MSRRIVGEGPEVQCAEHAVRRRERHHAGRPDATRQDEPALRIRSQLRRGEHARFARSEDVPGGGAMIVLSDGAGTSEAAPNPSGASQTW